MNKHEADAVFYRWTAWVLGVAYAITLGMLLYVCAREYGKWKVTGDNRIIKVQLGVMK